MQLSRFVTATKTCPTYNRWPSDVAAVLLKTDNIVLCNLLDLIYGRIFSKLQLHEIKRSQLQLQLHKLVQLITFSSLIKRTLDEIKNTRSNGKTLGVAPLL